jgi:hypothetical protein
MVPSRFPLLGTGVCVTQPYSGNRSEPPIAGCRLGTVVRSRERIRVRLVHRIGCPKHGIRSGSSWISGICCPRLYRDCGQSCSTRPGDPWPTGTDRAAASCRSSRQLKATPSSNCLLEITGLPPPNYRIEVLRQPLASDPSDSLPAPGSVSLASDQERFRRTLPSDSLASKESVSSFVMNLIP